MKIGKLLAGWEFIPSFAYREFPSQSASSGIKRFLESYNPIIGDDATTATKMDRTMTTNELLVL
eukprot:scaffold1899_cov182-Alexandrium_tamarense.AAC.29